MLEGSNDIKENFNISNNNTENNLLKSSKFIQNTCSNLLISYYIGKINNNDKKFYETTIREIENPYEDKGSIIYYELIVSILFSITFYLSLICFILTRKTVSLVFFIILYILGEILQIFILPNFKNFKSKSEFISMMQKILNCNIIIKYYDKRNKYLFKYSQKYVIDATGEICIPKDINFIRIGGSQLYSYDANNINNLYNDFKINYYYHDEPFEHPRNIYFFLNSMCFNHFIILLLYLTMLLWIYCLLSLFLPKRKYALIFPAKLLCDYEKESPTNIVIHGKSFIAHTIKNEVYENTLFSYSQEKERQDEEREEKKKKKEEEERIKRENEERKKKRKRELEEEEWRNTFTLSTFENNNYHLRVYRVFEEVYLKITIFNDKYENKIYLGKYNRYIKEDIKNNIENDTITYRPNGFNISIKVKKNVGQFLISVGNENKDIFDKSFYY